LVTIKGDESVKVRDCSEITGIIQKDKSG